jgi:aconitase A
LTARSPNVLGDPVTTDHIAPAGSIVIKNPPAQYLMDFLRYRLPRSADVGGRRGE